LRKNAAKSSPDTALDGRRNVLRPEPLGSGVWLIGACDRPVFKADKFISVHASH